MNLKKILISSFLLTHFGCNPYMGTKGQLKFIPADNELPSTSAQNYIEVKNVINKSCVSCHSAWADYNEDQFFNLKPVNTSLDPYIVPSDPESSWLLKKLKYNPTTLESKHGQKMPIGTNQNSFTNDDYEVFVKWIKSKNSNSQKVSIYKINTLLKDNDLVDFGSIIMSSGGSTLTFSIKNNLGETLTVSPIEIVGSDKFKVSQAPPSNIADFKTANFKVNFNPDNINDEEAVMLIKTASANFSFSLKGRGSDLLAQKGITCNPGVKKISYDYFKVQRKRVYLNNIANFLTPVGHLILKDAAISDKLDLYPNISQDDYVRVKNGGYNADLVEGSFQIANNVSDVLVNNQSYYGPLFSSIGPICNGAASSIESLSKDCLTATIKKLAKLSFSRTPEAGKLNFLFSKSYEAFDLGDKKSALAGAVIVLMLQPEFYFYMDGSNDSISTNRYRKSPPGLLRSLSVMLTDSYPDETAIDMMEAGKLETNSGYQEIINHLLSLTSPDGRNLASARVYESLREYLLLDQNSGFGSDPEMFLGLLPDYNSRGINTNATQYGSQARDGREADLRLLAYHILENNSTSEELLSSPMVVALNPLQKFVTGASNISLNPQAVTGRASRGIALSYRYMNGGSKFYRNPFSTASKWLKIFFCEEIGNPDPATFPKEAFEAPPLSPNKTIREVYHSRTDLASCKTCHDRINPVGFALDSINAVGEDTEDEKFFNAQGELLAVNKKDTHTSLEIAGQFLESEDAFTLRDNMKNLKTFELCLAQKFTSYAYQTKAVDDKGCAVTNSFKKIVNENRPLKELFLPHVLDPQFRELHFDPN